MRSETLLDDLDATIGSERRSGRLPIPGLSREDIESLKLQGNRIAALAGETTSKSYLSLHKHRNVISNSILKSFNCPRRFIQEKIQANQPGVMEARNELPNIDFVFGHSVGAGVATYLAFDLDIASALYATFISWYGRWELGREDYNERKKKNIERALLAVEKFASWWRSSMADDWELVRLDGDRPATEVSFCIDFGRTKYFGHIDLILRNTRTGKIAIGENKTTGFFQPHEALYRNSGQALGYAVVLDKMFPGLTDYEVLYYAYSAIGEEWHFLPFAKTTAQKLEWIQDRLLDSGHLQQYYEMKHFPKNGDKCYEFNRPCSFFGTCDLVDKEAIDKLPLLEGKGEEEYPVDYYFDLEDLIKQQVEGV